MAEMVELKNIAKPRRMLVLNLDKNIANIPVKTTVVVENKQGERRQKRVSALVPDSLRIPSGHTIKVSKKISECTAIQKALTRRELTLKSVKSETTKRTRNKR